jgi:hypothetical protein
LVAACLNGAAPRSPATIATAPPPSTDEHYCAWYGHADGDVLYFGQSGFWSAHRASGGRPTADFDRAGPALIGRFDLAREEFLPPLDVRASSGVAGSEDRSGVWDVFAHPNGRVYFTTYFASAGSVDPATGAVQRFPAAGRGLNEIAPGPDDSLLVSRYGAEGGRNGGVVVLDPDGHVLEEFELTPPPGFIAAAKSVAYDRLRREIWVTTDLLPVTDAEGGVIRHDTFVLDANGAEIARIESPEVQFVAFASDGTGYRAEIEGGKLWLRIVRPDGKTTAGNSLRIPLEHAFAADFDFVQDIQFSADGRAVITRWSGWVHILDVSGAIRSLRLPPFEPRGIYYSAGLHAGRVCATHCGDVTVVCQEFDPLR